MNKGLVVEIILVVVLGSFSVAFISGWNPFASPNYFPPGYAGSNGAPNGVYLQNDWGWVNSVSFPVSIGGWVTNATSWSFGLDGPGPLHGDWPIANGTAVPIWHDGVFPSDARLYVTIKNNTIVHTEVKSAWAYGD
jgi:hypothetical protein